MSGPVAISVKDLFLAARELQGAARAAYLNEVCAADPIGRRRVEALLRAETALGSDLLSPAPAVPVVMEDIDRYELLDVLGEGGFGTVYRAQRRGGVDTEVALKVLRAGLESGEALARFRIEQKSLETMEHPGIARVLDAGLTRIGRPYLVMELVRGEAITAFCDRERLSIAERIVLMADVCRAVQHAHHKGVIHRDLKPSNILAWRSEGEGGRVWAKVIDFGVAKAIRDAGREGEAMATVTQGARAIGTPAYMSPEQARGGQDVDTRADVYALGAVLYELLCGSPVIDGGALAGASPGEVERLVCEVEPYPPSERVMLNPERDVAGAARSVDGARLHRSLRGELDWIPLRALEKDRARRYATPEELAADLERSGRGEAVSAAPPSRRYRLARAYRRNRGVSIAAGVAALALLVGASIAVREAGRARAAEQRAGRDRRIAEAVSTFLQQDMLGSLRPEAGLTGVGGRDVSMREVMDKASRRLEEAAAAGGSLEGEPTVRASLHTTFANTYLVLGKPDAAEAHARAAVEAAMQSGQLGTRSVIRARIVLGRAVMVPGTRTAEAVTILEEVVDQARRGLGEDDQDRLEAEVFLGVVLSNGNKDIKRALDLFKHCYEVWGRTRGPDNPSTLFAGYLYAHSLVKLGDFRVGEALQKKIYEARRRVLGERHHDTLWSKIELARAKLRRGDGPDDEAVAMFEEIIRDRADVLGLDHFETLAATEELGNHFLQTRRLDRAEGLLRPLFEHWQRTGGDDHPRTIRVESALGEALARRGDFEHGVPMMTDALERVNRLTAEGGDHYDASWIRWRVEVARKAREKGSWDGVE